MSEWGLRPETVAGSRWDKSVKDLLLFALIKDEVEDEKREGRAFSVNQRWPCDEAAKAEFLYSGKEESYC